jgi:hypothetical protein
VEALVEQSRRLPLGSFVGFFFTPTGQGGRHILYCREVLELFWDLSHPIFSLSGYS